MTEREKHEASLERWRADEARSQGWAMVLVFAIAFLPWPVLYLIGQYIN